MNYMRTISVVMYVSILVVGVPLAQAATIRSWNSATQRGGDLYSAGTSTYGYSSLETALLADGHTILPGVSTLSAANLAGLDVFFWGTSSTILSALERTVLANFVQGGGSLLLESNSASNERASANSATSALGLGSPYGGTGGSQGPTAGLFQDVVTRTTVGTYGDLRGLRFGSSIVADIDPTGGILIGTNDSLRCMVEFAPYVGGGGVLAVGDPYGFNLFMNPSSSYYNANNLTAYRNFIPEPATLSLLALGGLGMLRRRRVSTESIGQSR